MNIHFVYGYKLTLILLVFMAKNPFNIGIFNGPSYSGFSIAHGNRVSTKPGIIKPVWCDFLDTGERLKDLDLGSLVRQAPMLAPTLDTYEVTIDAFAIRLRSLGMASRDPWKYEDFFNYNKNIDGSLELPSFYLGRFWIENNPLKLGTLYESLNYPSWKWLREMILEQARNLGWVYNPVVEYYQYHITYDPGTQYYTREIFVGPSSLIQEEYSNSGVYCVDLQNVAGTRFQLNHFPSRPSFVSLDYYTASSVAYKAFPSLVNFALYRYPAAFKPVEGWDVPEGADHNYAIGFSMDFTNYIPETPEPYNVLDKIYELYKVDAESVISEFEDYLLDSVLNLLIDDNNVYTASLSPSQSLYTLTGGTYFVNSLFSFIATWLFKSMPDVPYEQNGSTFMGCFEGVKNVITDAAFISAGWPTDDNYEIWADRCVPKYFLDSYWKIISDWYINTAIFEPDTFFLDHYGHADRQTGSYEPFKTTNELFFRYWKNDYFTSAFPNSQLGQAVGIPVNGTIIDFRNANAWQKFKERLQYAGSRFRDVLFAVTGKRTSSAIMDMSEPLGRWKSIINVDSLLQTSESSSKSPQAAYAGTGLAYKMEGRSVSYTAEEPTVIMVVMNINPVAAAYFDGFPRKFLRTNLYQYDVPNLANVGEQQVYNYELFYGPDSRMGSAGYNPIFGWQRRYGDFMWTPDEVHGDFRGNLDYWHNARTFVNAPRLNERFLQVRPDDDNLNRVFAVSSPVVDKFYCHVFFSGHIIRHLPKHAYYDL